jgi:hypothetical protein
MSCQKGTMSSRKTAAPQAVLSREIEMQRRLTRNAWRYFDKTSALREGLLIFVAKVQMSSSFERPNRLLVNRLEFDAGFMVEVSP